MENKIVFDATIECIECEGTGLYKGMAEHGKSAVICCHCNGTGCRHIHHEYNTFTGRKRKENVERVYKSSSGYYITDEDVTTEEGKLIEFSKAGISYDMWMDGMTPLPIKDLECPLQFYGQGTTVGEFLKSCGPCEKNLTLGGYIPKCNEKNREACWEWYKEHRDIIPK